MFGLFKKKSPIDKLQTQYEQLMKEAHGLMSIDRKASDAKYGEAEKVADQITALQESEKG
jgi:hypothetical protein